MKVSFCNLMKSSLENNYLRKRLECHATDVERAEARLKSAEAQKTELDHRYNELLEKFRMTQQQMKLSSDNFGPKTPSTGYKK